MEILDIVLLALFIPGVIAGIAKGFINQVISLAAVFVGAFIAVRHAPDLADVLTVQFGGDGRIAYLVAFIAIFLGCALIMALIGHLITKLFKAATLGWLNRFFGMVFSLFTTALILGLLISAFEGLNESWHLIDPERLANLRVWPLLRDFASGIFPQIKAFVEQYITMEPESCLSV